MKPPPFFLERLLVRPGQDTGGVGDKGVLAVPVDYGDDGPDGDGVLKIDWASIEAANAGVHLPDKTDEQYTSRILFSRVSEDGRTEGKQIC